MPNGPRRPWRLIAGVAIVTLWIGGLALLARRELLRPMSERLADAALQIHPVSHYYIIERDDVVIGGASAEVDTTGYGIAFRQHLFGRLLEGDSSIVVVRSRASYTPTLHFGGFRIDLERGAEQFVLTGQRTDDSVLVVTLNGSDGSTSSQRAIAADPLFLPPAAPLPLMLLRQPKVGSAGDVTVFDPLGQRPRTIPLRIVAESSFALVDSVAFDPERRRWVPARRESLRGWLVTSDSTPISAWIDRSGAVIQATDGRGSTIRRTAYEIAFENWRLSRAEETP